MNKKGKDAFDPKKAAERKHTGDEIITRTAPLPAFFTDPSLLPKKPPTAARPPLRREEKRA